MHCGLHSKRQAVRVHKSKSVNKKYVRLDQKYYRPRRWGDEREHNAIHGPPWVVHLNALAECRRQGREAVSLEVHALQRRAAGCERGRQSIELVVADVQRLQLAQR